MYKKSPMTRGGSDAALLRITWYKFISKLRYNISIKDIRKWARHKVRPKGTEYNQSQDQMRSVSCGINAFYDVGNLEG